MALSPDEIKERHLQARKSHAESMVLARWYGMLLFALKNDGVSGVRELDMRKHWIGGDFDLVKAIRDYHKAAGIEGEIDTDTLVTEFIKELIGGQLSELGLEPRRVHVVAGMDDAYWVFMLKPGQKPIIWG